MPASVSPQYLLEGAVYALEQCGLLLRDANVLYRNGSYASAVALARFAHEELGQWKILRDLRAEVLGGKHLTIKDIQNACKDHETKQRAGALSTTITADRNSGIGKLIMTPVGSKGWREAREQIEKWLRKMAKRTPSDRHEQRMSALYVDPVAPDQWSRPIKKISATAASKYLQDVLNDYLGPYDRYTDPENAHYLGHRNLQSTARYTALSPDRFRGFWSD
jgi:AbiV family abortive infection protein